MITSEPINTELFMQCDNLNFPIINVPEGFKILNYKSGDMETWITIQSQTEKLINITNELYFQTYGNDDKTLSERQFFIIDTKLNKAVGTASAWFLDLPVDLKKASETSNSSIDNCEKESWGRLHWVCILPEYQGKGLGKAIVSFTLQKLIELGHKKIFLDTDTRRENAVHIYKSFGFKEQDKDVIKVIKTSIH